MIVGYYSQKWRHNRARASLNRREHWRRLSSQINGENDLTRTSPHRPMLKRSLSRPAAQREHTDQQYCVYIAWPNILLS